MLIGQHIGLNNSGIIKTRKGEKKNVYNKNVYQKRDLSKNDKKYHKEDYGRKEG